MSVDLSRIRTVEEAAELVRGRECVCQGMGYVRMPVEPGHPLFGKAVPCPCKQDAVKRVRAEAMQRRSGLSKNALERFTFDSFRPGFAVVPEGADGSVVWSETDRAKAACQAWAERPVGWLVLSGVRGCGKTHLAVAVAGRQLAASRPVYYGTATQMLNVLRGSYEQNAHESYIRDLQRVDVLIVDELGGERRTDWSEEQLFDVLDHRYIERNPVMLCTNAAPGDGSIQARLASRMREGVDRSDGFVTEVVLPAGDCRPKVGWAPPAREM